ncbi:elongation of very long chain fatty acids protein 7-like isoform X2 [Macrosteles quadrilineatus]|uniref:elongation of very long chain fatty acids protein 7-like isoform X2 n=1 Tax=Macrosteles quadrilineatus TaxID=74068 RepID=UPI0023E1D7F2|nr:elongation of very long chain fatty acids protein 7-like isoform X2 [Macrosteles quadrilineatus]
MALSNFSSTGSEDFYKMVDKESITQNWTLTHSPIPVSLSILVYLLIVVHFGPKIMASRKPYYLKTFMRVYNIIQIVYNAFVLSQFLYCSWHYFVLKLLDLFDTVFMVLRKKNTHITFLHIYHHCAMVVFTWYSNKYIKAQQATIPALINTAVHCVMYFYYFLATFGPGMQKQLWWKKYLTTLQLGQFAVVILYLWLLYHQDCQVSQDFNVIWIINVAVIAAFFVNFYIQTYIVKPQSQLRCKTKKQ